jgi:hypothetical protein
MHFHALRTGTPRAQQPKKTIVSPARPGSRSPQRPGGAAGSDVPRMVASGHQPRLSRPRAAPRSDLGATGSGAARGIPARTCLAEARPTTQETDRILPRSHEFHFRPAGRARPGKHLDAASKLGYSAARSLGLEPRAAGGAGS